jgi:hypothetical protein
MKLKLFFPLCLLGLLVACGPSTQISKSWSDPSLTSGSAQNFKKILVVCALKDEASRRTAEDKVAVQIKNIEVVKSYNYLKPEDTDQKQLEERLKNDGFDGIILMHLTDVDKSVSYSPGTSYGGWYGYRYSTPGYFSEDKTFFVETNFYSVNPGKLLWSCTTSTLNPTKLDQTLDDIISSVRIELQKKGLIKS